MQVSGLQWHHVLSADLTSEYSFLPDDLLDFHLSIVVSYVTWFAYPHNMSSNPATFDQSHPINLSVCGRSDFGLWHIAPRLVNGWVLLGEMDKLVPVSEQRIRAVATTGTEVIVELVGVPGEQVSISFWNPSETPRSNASEGKLMKYTCAIQGRGLVTLVVPEGTCT